MIKIENLNWEYEEREILKDINIDIEKGKFYTILGQNGSGKTTFIKNIVGILENKNAKIYIDGKKLKDYSKKEIAKKIALVSQQEDINFNFTVEEVVSMGRNPYIEFLKTETEKDREIIKKAIKIANIEDLKNRYITELSGGEKQRVILARAIAQDTKILILDEPTSNIDIKNQIEILDTIKKLQIEKEITIIAVFHDINIGIRYNDNIIFLKDRTIYKTGNTKDILTAENIKEVYDIEVEIIKVDSKRSFIIPKYN